MTTVNEGKADVQETSGVPGKLVKNSAKHKEGESAREEESTAAQANDELKVDAHADEAMETTEAKATTEENGSAKPEENKSEREEKKTAKRKADNELKVHDNAAMETAKETAGDDDSAKTLECKSAHDETAAAKLEEMKEHVTVLQDSVKSLEKNEKVLRNDKDVLIKENDELFKENEMLRDKNVTLEKRMKEVEEQNKELSRISLKLGSNVGMNEKTASAMKELVALNAKKRKNSAATAGQQKKRARTAPSSATNKVAAKTGAKRGGNATSKNDATAEGHRKKARTEPAGGTGNVGSGWPKFKVDDQVEANWTGQPSYTFWLATILNVTKTEEGTTLYDVKYDESDDWVCEGLAGKKVRKRSCPKEDAIQKGERVWGYDEKGKREGTVVDVYVTDRPIKKTTMYSIDFDDEEKTISLKGESVRRM